MLFPKLRGLMQALISTPFHPQWHNHRLDRRFNLNLQILPGDLLDVGAGNGKLKEILPDTTNYIGLDYPVTVAKGYTGVISVYGDGMALPFKDGSFDTVAMLDVLEHIPDAAKAFQESARVLRPGGELIIKVPFLYPLHDRPHDFHRWTSHGLRRLAELQGMRVKYCGYFGEPGESLALIANLGLCTGILTAMEKRKYCVLFAPFIMVLVPLINVFGYVISKIFPKDDLMPLGYAVVLVK